MPSWSGPPGWTTPTDAVMRLPPSPYNRIFREGMAFISDLRPAGAAEGPVAHGSLTGTQLEAFKMVLGKDIAAERDAMGHYIPWLATVGSVGPLLGLLGTVLGVMEAFIGIASKGSGNIAAVAPGVAEALVTTVAGLATAIPAVIAYNLFVNRLNVFAAELEGFANELIGTMAREGRALAWRACSDPGTAWAAAGDLPLNADINVTSLVDVAFVLLIIFMITAPIMQGGVDVQLPRAEARPLTAKEGMVISVDRQGRIFIDETPVTYHDFRVTFGSHRDHPEAQRRLSPGRYPCALRRRRARPGGDPRSRGERCGPGGGGRGHEPVSVRHVRRSTHRSGTVLGLAGTLLVHGAFIGLLLL